MQSSWVPWSAASLASGAILLLMGVMMMPNSPDVAQLLASIAGEDDRWLMASFAFFLSGVALTVGLPSILVLLTRHPRSAVAGLVIWAFGTVAMSGYGAILILFRAVAERIDLTPADVEAVGSDAGLAAFLGVMLGCFYVAELWVALALLRARTVSVWAPVLLLGHIALGVAAQWLPDHRQGLTTVLLSVALLIVAVQANETVAGALAPAGTTRRGHQPRW